MCVYIYIHIYIYIDFQVHTVHTDLESFHGFPLPGCTGSRREGLNFCKLLFLVFLQGKKSKENPRKIRKDREGLKGIDDVWHFFSPPFGCR